MTFTITQPTNHLYKYRNTEREREREREREKRREKLTRVKQL